ncbi:MAG: alpha/beta-type small acid-soluble spore protein [bacterium]|jgi:hypothetical protein
MARGSYNRSRGATHVVPEAWQAMNNWKYEIARELGVDSNIQNGYWGNVSSRDAGSVGGHMTRKMVEMAQQQLAAKTPPTTTR